MPAGVNEIDEIDVVNTAQFEAWNGYEGVHWAEHQERWDAVNREVNDHLLGAAGIREGDGVLDVGCGAGQTTRLAARRAARGHVLGIDLSAPMLARARATAAAEGIRNVTFRQGDAQVYPFPSGSFDVALSRFGVMFFGDPVAAFANIGRALKPGGQLAFVCMQDLSQSDLGLVFAEIARHAPAAGAGGPEPSEPSEPSEAPGMLSLADPVRTAQTLELGGFQDVTVRPIEFPMLFGRDAEDAARFLLSTGPARDLLGPAGGSTEGRALDSLVATLRPHQGADGVRLGCAAWLVTARRPGGPGR